MLEACGGLTGIASTVISLLAYGQEIAVMLKL